MTVDIPVKQSIGWHLEWCNRGKLEPHKSLKCWSTGPELNRRILVLQTSALATSPPVLMSPLSEGELVQQDYLAKNAHLAAPASSFFARYQVSTVNPAPAPFVRLRASSSVTGARTMTGSSGFQLAGADTPLSSIVRSAWKTRTNLYITPQLHRVVDDGSNICFGSMAKTARTVAVSETASCINP
jgi:hypothetical protein